MENVSFPESRSSSRGTANVDSGSDYRNSQIIATLSCIQRFIIQAKLSSMLVMEVGSLIKKQGNSPDDIVPAIAEIIAEILKNLSDNRGILVKGFSFIAPGPSLPPVVFRMVGEDDRRRLRYETIESEDYIFITAKLPPYLVHAPYVEIMRDAVHVIIEGRAAVIIPKTPVDGNRSHFTVHNRVLDITLKKIKKT